MPGVPEPDFDDPKEMYAFFGLAAYAAQLLEQSLINLFVAHRLRGVPLTPANANDLFGLAQSKTLGQLIRSTAEIVSVPEGTEQRLRQALEKRNYLSHHFFRDHDQDMLSRAGTEEVIRELRDMVTLFNEADALVDPLWKAAWSTLGMTEERLQEEMKKVYSEARVRDEEAF